jgi:hypothetical protein
MIEYLIIILMVQVQKMPVVVRVFCGIREAETVFISIKYAVN